MRAARAISADGTPIAYERAGSGPPLVLVGGALTGRTFGVNVSLAKALAGRYTVYSFDRRGRGESSDTRPYAVRREVEDVAAVIEAAGGHAFLYGVSSGAILALEAACALPGMVDKLAVYEAPCVVDTASRPPVPADGAQRLAALIGDGQRGAAVRVFLADYSQVPGAFVALLKVLPPWRKLTGVAHTLPYDLAVMAGLQQGNPLPAGRWQPSAPVLVIAGGKSPAWLKNAQLALRDVLPGAEHQTLAGQTHVVRGKVLAPLLAGWFVT